MLVVVLLMLLATDKTASLIKLCNNIKKLARLMGMPKLFKNSEEHFSRKFENFEAFNFRTFLEKYECRAVPVQKKTLDNTANEKGTPSKTAPRNICIYACFTCHGIFFLQILQTVEFRLAILAQ